VSGAALAAAILLATPLWIASPAQANGAQCAVNNGAMQINPECVDPDYSKPVIDSETDETSPVAHHRIRGHFEGTDIQFNLYFHAKKDLGKWQGRFFQYTYPTAFTAEEDTSRADDRAIKFALSSGGYAVQSGNKSFSLGYRHTAAAAQFAEQLAAKYYGSNREISGYLYGPSGGSYQTTGAAENTEGIWQGFVPMVQGVPQPTTYNFMGRAAAELILGDKAEQISKALLPGGSGNPYTGLDKAERTMLKEIHDLGIPWKAWEYPDYLLGRTAQYPSGLGSSAPLGNDPTYMNDFWNAPGYLGTEQSPLGTRVRAELEKMGDTVENRWNIANRFYYRYQTPKASEGWTGLKQFIESDGSPRYPQRPVKDPGIHGFVSGNAAFDGSITGKVIVVDNLYDSDALPWHADWYRKRVEASLGDAASDSYRLYYNDHADHQDAPVSGERSKHLVNWYGMAEQALRDVAKWAEDDIAPPASTNYEIRESQVVLPKNANDRGGIQPTVELSVKGKQAANVKTGERVTLKAKAQVPRGAGKIVKAEWDLDGDGIFTDAPLSKVGKALTLKTTASFSKPGSRLVAIRITSEREGDTSATQALAQNLDRVRINVSSKG